MNRSELRALAEAAEGAGGWWTETVPGRVTVETYLEEDRDSDIREEIESFTIADCAKNEADAAYIVAACNALPTLLDRLEAAEELLRRDQEEHHTKGHWDAGRALRVTDDIAAFLAEDTP